jgi:hypothetical protein
VGVIWGVRESCVEDLLGLGKLLAAEMDEGKIGKKTGVIVEVVFAE